MLKKVLKRTLAVALTVATVVTASVPVGAAALKPKKSHSKAEITEYVNYFNSITEAYTFRPDGYVPGIAEEGNHESYSYEAYKMTVLLQNTKGITAEQKADMKKAASLWKKSYISQKMLNYYWKTWSDYMYYGYVSIYDGTKSSRNSASSYKARAKQTYNKVNTYISKNAKYNGKLAGELKKFNKKRLDAWNKDIDKWFKMSKKQKARYSNCLVDYLGSFDSTFCKVNMAENPGGNSVYSIGYADGYGDKEHYETQTLGIWGYDLSEYSPSRELYKHTRWTKW